MRKKTVGNIMTRLDDIFMLNYESVLDFETVSEILKQGTYTLDSIISRNYLTSFD